MLREEYKKERTRSKPKFAIFADPLPVVPHQPNFVCRFVFQISFLVLSFRKMAEKCGSSGGRIFGFPIDLAHHLYNNLLLSHKL